MKDPCICRCPPKEPHWPTPSPSNPRSTPSRSSTASSPPRPPPTPKKLLVVYDILKAAHANGTLDLINGLVGGRDIIAGKLAEYAKLPGGINAIRNLLAAGKILMAIDPETLDQVSKALVTATGQHRGEQRAPSLLQLAARAVSEDSRRGLSLLTLLLSGIGRNTNAPQDHADPIRESFIPVAPRGAAPILLAATACLGTAMFLFLRKKTF